LVSAEILIFVVVFRMERNKLLVLVVVFGLGIFFGFGDGIRFLVKCEKILKKYFDVKINIQMSDS